MGIPLYIVGWLMIPAEGPERPVVARLLSRQDTWLVAAGMGCLVLAAVLLLRQWGLWFFSDSIVWPVVSIAVGRRADLAPVAGAGRSAQRRRPRPPARCACPATRPTARSPARRWWSAAR